MRLSLLARKLSVKPSVIIEELLIEGEKPLHGNSKLSEDQIEEIVKIFGPLPEETEASEPMEESPSDQLAEEDKPSLTQEQEPEVEPDLVENKSESSPDTTEILPEQITSEDVDPSLDIEAEAFEQETEEANSTDHKDIPEIEVESDTETEVDEESSEVIDEAVTSEDKLEVDAAEVNETIDSSSNGHTEKLEEATEDTEKRVVLVSDLLEDPDEDLLANSDVLIKAPKVHLPGLTVKGKIELPEPKPKPEKEATDKDEESEDHRGRRGRNRGKRRKQTNPVAAARMREERQAERRKKAKQAQEKERKRKHYQQNIQSKAAPPPKKKISKRPTEMEPGNTKAAPEKSLNALQRFWKWMNT